MVGVTSDYLEEELEGGTFDVSWVKSQMSMYSMSSLMLTLKISIILFIVEGF